MKIIIWLNSSPVCCKGIFDALAAKHGVELVYACLGRQREDRKLISAEAASDNETSAEYIYFAELKDVDRAVEEFIQSNLEVIHVFNGCKMRVLDQVIKKAPDSIKIVWAERPGPPKWKAEFPLALFHSYYAFKYKNKIDAFLPLGKKGVELYSSYGWPKKMLFPFLYLPEMTEDLPEKDPIADSDRLLRMVYLGRFQNGPKGVDVLLRALDTVGDADYAIDFVGGYGADLEETMSWIDSKDSAHFAGTWPIEKACNNLYDYDLCIVPSRYEGWNVTVNESIMAGTPCICTDECVSDEMVLASGAGLVVKAGSQEELANAIQLTLSNRTLVDEWSRSAYRYRKKMTAGMCSDYLLRIIKYLQHAKGGDKAERPMAPWLESN